MVGTIIYFEKTYILVFLFLYCPNTGGKGNMFHSIKQLIKESKSRTIRRKVSLYWLKMGLILGYIDHEDYHVLVKMDKKEPLAAFMNKLSSTEQIYFKRNARELIQKQLILIK